MHPLLRSIVESWARSHGHEPRKVLAWIEGEEETPFEFAAAVKATYGIPLAAWSRLGSAPPALDEKIAEVEEFLRFAGSRLHSWMEREAWTFESLAKELGIGLQELLDYSTGRVECPRAIQDSVATISDGAVPHWTWTGPGQAALFMLGPDGVIEAPLSMSQAVARSLHRESVHPFLRWLGPKSIREWAEEHKLSRAVVQSWLRLQQRRPCPALWRDAIARESKGAVPASCWDDPANYRPRR